jgi:acylphosphatase
VSGIVQGVFYRQSTKKTALSIGLTGWVRNTSDEGVEAVFEGDEERILQMIAWCRRGPPAARVDDVTVTWEKRLENLKDFEIRY